ncbi:MAG: hypothetical protein KC733_11750, partial [Candidatus Omnitrophica bacterium]|nr:hypothetical protein [Candidatus Omnitrophota bacterium]
DINKNINALAQSPFWMKIGAIQWDLVLDEMKLAPHERAIVEKVQQELSNVTQNPLFQNLFSKEAVVAVYPYEQVYEDITKLSNQEMIKAVESFFSKFLIVTRLSPEVQVLEILTRSIEKYGANVTLEKEEYNNETINLLKVKNTPVVFAYARLKDLLVIGFGSDGVKASIDVFLKQGSPLAGSSDYAKKSGRFVKSADMESYWNVDSLLKFLEDQIKIRSKFSQHERVEDYFQMMRAFQSVVISMDMDKINTIKTEIMLDKSQLPADVLPMYNCRSVENASTAFVPKDVIGYQWNKCFDLGYYWNQMQRDLQQMPAEATQQQIASIEGFLGMSIEKDLIPAIGDEIGGFMKDLDMSGPFPLPKIALFIKVKNKDTIQKLLDLLKTVPLVALQNEEYSNVAYHYVALPLGEALQPGYFYLDDYLIIAMNRQLIKDSIDAYKNGENSFKDNKAFASYPIFKEKNMSFYFIRTDQIMAKFKGLIEWGNRFNLSQSAKQDAFRAGAERRLDDVNGQYEAKEQESTTIDENITKVEDEIWLLESKNEDAASKRNQLAELQKDKGLVADDLEKLSAQKQELQEVISGYDSRGQDPQKRQFLLDQVVFPILDAIETNEWFVSTGKTTNDSFEFLFSIKGK